jgi:hypothetical protein
MCQHFSGQRLDKIVGKLSSYKQFLYLWLNRPTKTTEMLTKTGLLLKMDYSLQEDCGFVTHHNDSNSHLSSLENDV